MTMVRRVLAGTTDVSVVIRIIDSTDGTPETGVVWNTAGIDLEYRRELAASVDITEATLAALTTAHADGGFLHIGNGYYRLDLPDAACASGVTGVLVHGTVTGMVVIGCYIELVAYNPYDAVRLGLTALPNAAAEAAGGLYTRGSGAGQINQNANGQVDTRTVAMAADVVTAAAIAANAITSSEFADGTITSAKFAAGAINAAAIATDAIDADALADGAITAATFAAGAIDATAIAADAIGSSELAASAVTEIQSGLSTLDAAGVRTAVGLAAANLDTQLAAIDDYIDAEIAALTAAVAALPTANANADALLDRANGIETSYTLRQALRLLLASAAGKLSGAATTTIVIRNVGDTVSRITATVDADGNRSAITYDVS